MIGFKLPQVSNIRIDMITCLLKYFLKCLLKTIKYEFTFFKVWLRRHGYTNIKFKLIFKRYGVQIFKLSIQMNNRRILEKVKLEMCNASYV